MAQYCDTKKLEQEWFNWLLAKSTPQFESYRQMGVLYTKMCDVVKNKDGTTVVGPAGRTYPDPRCSQKFHLISGKFIETVNGEIVVEYEAGDVNRDGFIKEAPTNDSWNNMLVDINNMCAGISTKFTLNSEEEYQELAGEAFIQVANKLVNNKLIYTPGKAPVFNLLTTTIYRCIFSILNKRNRKKGQFRSLSSTDDESSMVKTKHLCKSYLKIK